MGILAIFAFNSPYLKQVERAKLAGEPVDEAKLRKEKDGFVTNVIRFVLAGGEPGKMEAKLAT